MQTDITATIELVAQTCLYAEGAARQGSVTVVGLDPEGDIVLPVRVRDDDWRSALANLPTLIDRLQEQGHRPAALIFCFGIGNVEFLYDHASLNRLADAISNIYAGDARDAGDAGQDADVEVVRIVGAELDRRNIAMTFIGNEFTWIFDRSTSTFVGSADAKKPPVPVLTLAV